MKTIFQLPFAELRYKLSVLAWADRLADILRHSKPFGNTQTKWDHVTFELRTCDSKGGNDSGWNWETDQSVPSGTGPILTPKMAREMFQYLAELCHRDLALMGVVEADKEVLPPFPLDLSKPKAD